MTCGSEFNFGIIIPVLADKDALVETLSALRLLPESDRQETICVIAVNSNEKSSPAEIADNEALLALAAADAQEFRTGCAKTLWLDLKVKAKEGVGMARKKAVEAAEPFLAENALIFSLDADTVVETDYIAAAAGAFAANPDWAGASVRFAHRVAEGAPAGMQEAVEKYEKYLLSYSDGLRNAGSPYGYPVMGSAMAWRRKAGQKAGGMRVRAGGEDFYFLQALRKVGIIGYIDGTVVHPLARCSQRVPFGTGPRLIEILDGRFAAEPYPESVFAVLRMLLESVRNELPQNYAYILPEVHPAIGEWLNKMEFPEAWRKILQNTPAAPEARRKAFHVWFDAFKTLKFIHFLVEKEKTAACDLQ